MRRAICILLTIGSLCEGSSAHAGWKSYVGEGLRDGGFAFFLYGLYAAGVRQYERKNGQDNKFGNCLGSDQECLDEHYRKDMRIAGGFAAVGLVIGYSGAALMKADGGGGKSSSDLSPPSADGLQLSIAHDPIHKGTAFALSRALH